jgi:chitodextrinase
VVNLSGTAGINTLLSAFGSEINGVVEYDPDVWATSNVASTIAGVEDLVAIRKDTAAGSLYHQYVLNGPQLPVVKSLVGMFTGTGTIPGTTRPSTGSKKCDAYIWAKINYLDNGKCNPQELAYWLDSYWLQKPFGISTPEHLLFNHDYIVAKRGFVFDLSSWGDEKPVDDPNQPLGTDLATKKEILLSAYNASGGKMIHVSGFTPWWFKYTTSGGGSHQPVPTEWEWAKIASSYNAFMDADATSYSDMVNASVFTLFPLPDRLIQNPKPSPQEMRRLGYLDPSGAVAPANFIYLYLGDYDSAAWIDRLMPNYWTDVSRGQTPLGWAFNPNLIQRHAVAFDHFFRTKSDRDFFIAGDSGAGYINPTNLNPTRNPSGLPSGAAAWAAHCEPYFRQLDYSITGFLLNGYCGKLNSATELIYRPFSGDGLMTQGAWMHTGSHLEQNMPVALQIGDLSGSTGDMANTIHQNGVYGATNFISFRTIIKSPTAIKNVVDSVRSANPSMNYHSVDPHVYFYLLRKHLGGNNDKRATYTFDTIPRSGCAGDLITAQVGVRNDGWDTWYASGSGRTVLAVSLSPTGGRADAVIVPLSRDIQPGEGEVLTVQLTIPAMGNHKLMYQMRTGDSGWFEDAGDLPWRADFYSDEPPSIPTNVQASVLSASSVLLTWTASTDNQGVAGYKIFRNGAQVGTSTTTTYTDTGLQPDTTYSYTVSAYDLGGNNSAQSSPPAVATTPPDVEPPSVPANVKGTAQSITSILLTWDASTDNVAVAGYRVYRHGVLLGTNTWPNYADTGLTPGTSYTYTVTAYDAVGNESAHSSPPTVVATPLLPDFCSVDMGSTDINKYLSRVAFNDGGTTAVNVGGLNCRQPSNTSNQYFYFAIDDTYIYNGSIGTAYLEVCYFDDPSGFIEPQYDSTASVYTALPQVTLTGTGKWQTATWTLTDCMFANRQNGGADFRLYVGQNQVRVDSVRISKTPFAGHISVERDLGVNEQYRGLSHPQYPDGDTIVAYKDEVYCKKPLTTGDDYFYFNVSDAVIFDGSVQTVYLKVGYYDNPDGLIKPEYDSMAGEYTPAETLIFSGTNTWTEHVWTLTDVKFANRQNSDADFRLYVGSAQNVFIDTVLVSKIPFSGEGLPGMPEDVQADGLTPSMIEVTWTAPTGGTVVAGYRVYRNGNPVGTSATTSYRDVGLVPNTAYSYTVAAFGELGYESARSYPVAIGSTMAAIGIPGVKELQDQSSVGMVFQIVTALFDGYFYVGDLDRHSGIRVVPIEMPEGLTVGQAVDIGGRIATTAHGERAIMSAVVHQPE